MVFIEPLNVPHQWLTSNYPPIEVLAVKKLQDRPMLREIHLLGRLTEERRQRKDLVRTIATTTKRVIYNNRKCPNLPKKDMFMLH